MASNNTLLGSGEPPKTKVEVIVKEVGVFDPLWMYHKDCLGGCIVKTKEEYIKLLEAGWEDHPGKCASLPGHEGLFISEEEEEEEEDKTVVDDSVKSKSKEKHTVKKLFPDK